MSFFLPKKRQDLPREKKRKRFNVSGRRPRAAGGEDPESGGAGGHRDGSAGQEEILSDASDVEGRPDAGYESDSDEERETAEAKRLRLAKKYLEEIENQGKSIYQRFAKQLTGQRIRDHEEHFGSFLFPDK